ncbi:MAG: DUF3883 domain-containing protein [Terrisporobacter sp.]
MSVYTEQEIMEVAIKILEEYGELNTTELKEILNDIMQPSGEDLQINKNRSDTKFDQKVRNMVSHRDTNDLYKYFDYSKNGRVGILTSKSMIKSSVVIKDEETPYGEVAKDTKKIEKRKEKKRVFNARKVDFEGVNKSNKELGDMGEKFVLEIEKRNLGLPLSEKVRHVSEEDGDGAGYDILSYTPHGDIRFLEVKTTTSGKETAFYISENERLFLETYGEDAEIVRVYNFDKDKKIGNIYRISGKYFIDQINLQPIAYKAKLK